VRQDLKHRVDAHILVAFLAYCLTATLKGRLQAHAPGLSPRAVLEKLNSQPSRHSTSGCPQLTAATW